LKKKYQYILGARVKNENKAAIKQILDLKLVIKENVM
jgi:hypothetical protein